MPELADRGSRRSWARLIQKIYEVDPLVGSKCYGQMRAIAFIEQIDVFRKTIKYLDLWDDKPKPLPTANYSYVSSASQHHKDTIPSADDMTVDPIHPVEAIY